MALPAEGGVRPDVYVGSNEPSTTHIFPRLRRLPPPQPGKNEERRHWFWAPMLKHGPNTAFGGKRP